MSLNHDISKAIVLLKNSEVVGMPTETVYGLAGRIDSKEAIQKIFTVKQRPFFDPLIVHVFDIDQAKNLVSEFPKAFEILAERFWPGSLTLVLPKSDFVSDLITSGLSTVALRCPDHPIALELIKGCGVPLAAPSANRFGRTSPTEAVHVKDEFGDQVFVLDGGPCRIGIESTIVRFDGTSGVNTNKVQLSLLRKGMISPKQIEDVLFDSGIEAEWLEDQGNKKISPGSFRHHYMPKVPIIALPISQKKEMGIQPLGLDSSVKNQIFQALKDLPDSWEGVVMEKPKVLNYLLELNLGDDPIVGARKLYALMRELSEKKPDALIWYYPKEESSGWSAIYERLWKAVSIKI